MLCYRDETRVQLAGNPRSRKQTGSLAYSCFELSGFVPDVCNKSGRTIRRKTAEGIEKELGEMRDVVTVNVH